MDGALGLGRLGVHGQGSSFTHCIRESQQVIRPRLLRRGRHGQPQDFPPARDGQGSGVLLAQIVTMRLRVSGQWPQYGCGVGIHVCQSSHRRLAAG
jgi:hypothetical protein